MLKSKYFWIAMVILVPFIIVWIMEGFGWAIATLVTIGVLFLIILGSTKRRRRRYTIIDDDYDEEIIVERGRRSPPSSFDTAKKWHIPTVNRKGAEFITGASSLRKRQEDAMRRTKKNLWG